MKKTVLEYVQACLSIMDGQEIDQIDDTVEATQIAYILQDLYYEMLNRGDWKFLVRAIPLVASGDTATPTHVTLPEDVANIHEVKYNVAGVGESADIRTLHFVELSEFLMRHSVEGEARQLVTLDRVQYYVNTDRMPTCYTVLDDGTLILDSFDSSIESTITSSRLGCVGKVLPVFSVTDTFVPDLPVQFVPLMQSTLNSYCMSNLKQQESAADMTRERRQLAQLRRDDSRGHPHGNYYHNKFGRR